MKRNRYTNNVRFSGKRKSKNNAGLIVVLLIIAVCVVGFVVYKIGAFDLRNGLKIDNNSLIEDDEKLYKTLPSEQRKPGADNNSTRDNEPLYDQKDRDYLDTLIKSR